MTLVKALRLFGPFWKVPFWRKKFHVFHIYLETMNILHISKKAELFNSFFANQRYLINNNSRLPRTLSCKTNERLSSVKTTDDDILKVIAKLDPNKADGRDKTSICMIKICSTCICKSLKFIFNHCIDNGIYIHASGKKLMLCQYTKKW